MRINVAKLAGFCFGVRRALHIAFQAAKSGAKIEMLGDIVHNEEVVRKINKLGIKKIKRLGKGDNKTLLIRAHGEPKRVIEEAHARGYTIVDATCPKVSSIHKIVIEMQRMGYKIIIIGDKKHDEVQGIVGQLKKRAIVIDRIKDISYIKIKRIKRAVVVVQSTQSLERVTPIVEVLKRYIKDLRFFNTICKPTRMKQEETKTLAKRNDVMIIIGSKTSANTKRLYQISKSLNKKSFWVQSKKDIKLTWLRGARSVGITAGASTPDSTTQGIIEYIRKNTRA
jgi:4-hydroxy-3-methylbut-2-enyl diphosphate reductase